MSSPPNAHHYNSNIQMEPLSGVANNVIRDRKPTSNNHDDTPMATQEKSKSLADSSHQNGQGSEKSPFLPGDIEVDIDNTDGDLDEFWTDEEEDLEQNEELVTKVDVLTRVVMGIQRGVRWSYNKLMVLTKGSFFKVLFFSAFMVYFVVAMNYKFGDEGSYRLLVCTAFGVFVITWRRVVPLINKSFWRCYGSDSLSSTHRDRLQTILFFLRWLCYGGLAALMAWTLIQEGRTKPENLRSIPGLLLFIFIPVFFSAHPSKINWHTIYWAVGMQFLFSLAVLKFEKGQEVVLWIQRSLDEFFACTHAGSKLLFGDSYKDHHMIFGALPIIFFTNATLSMLYYVGAIQFVVNVLGTILNFILHTSPAESTAVAAGIFMEGVTAILALRQYLPKLSKSQLFLVITQCFASLGGAYLAILGSIGISLRYLIPAMVVSAPATFAVCKIIVPETKWTREKDRGRQTKKATDGSQPYKSVMGAAQAGALAMIPLISTIAVVAFTFFSYIDWINKTLTWFGDRVGVEKLTIELISSYLLYPVALMMGIHPEDCRNVAMLLGFRLGINNIVAFIKLRHLTGNREAYNYYMMSTNFTGPVTYTRDDIHLDYMNVTLEGGILSDRSEAIVTYSLCGFSSFLSVAITMGIMATLVPNRKQWISKMSISALIAGNIANCMTGCFASIFY